MKSWLRILVWTTALFCLNGCTGTAGNNKENTYPNLRYFKAKDAGAALCVEGDCKDGKGTLLSLAYENRKYLAKYKSDPFYVTIYQGQFSQQGRIFNGDVHYFIRRGHNNARDEKGATLYLMYNPMNVPSSIRNSKALAYRGEMEALSQSDGEYGEKYYQYFPTKKGGQLFARYGEKSVDSMHIKGYEGRYLFAHIKYSASHPAFKEFYGLAHFGDTATMTYISPFLGEMTLKSGGSYTGGLWKNGFQGPGKLIEGAKTFEGVFSRGSFVRPAKLGISTDFKKIFEKAELISERDFGFQKKQDGPEFLMLRYWTKKKVDPTSLYWGPTAAGETDYGFMFSSATTPYFQNEDFNFIENKYHFFVSRYWVHATAPFHYLEKNKKTVPAFLAHGFYDNIEVPLQKTWRNSKNTLDYGGCATIEFSGKKYYGKYPLGWRVDDQGQVYVRGKVERYGNHSEAPLKFYRNDEYSLNLDGWMQDGSQRQKSYSSAIEATLKVANKDDLTCSKKLTREKREKYLARLYGNLEKSKKRAGALRSQDFNNWLAGMRAKREKERKRLARLVPCPVCGGSGYHVGTRANETRFAPTHTYRNGLKITERTTITSSQKYIAGSCGFCHGKGKVDKSRVKK